MWSEVKMEPRRQRRGLGGSCHPLPCPVGFHELCASFSTSHSFLALLDHTSSGTGLKTTLSETPSSSTVELSVVQQQGRCTVGPLSDPADWSWRERGGGRRGE